MMVSSPQYAGIKNKKVKYYVKTENFILWVISCVKSVIAANPDFLRANLNDYELFRLKYLKKWAETAPLEEIFGVMDKLGYEMFYGGIKGSVRGVKAGGQKKDAFAEGYLKNRDIEPVTKYAAENKYFVVASREIAKTQTLFSQIVNGAWYVPNKDYKSMMKVLKHAKKGVFDKGNINAETQNMKAVIRVFANFLLTKNEFISDLDMGILFYLADNDDAPVTTQKIYDVFTLFTKETSVVTRSLVKLRKMGHVYYYSSRNKKATTYALTSKGWRSIAASIKNYMSGIRFYDLEDEIKPTQP